MKDFVFATKESSEAIKAFEEGRFAIITDSVFDSRNIGGSGDLLGIEIDSDFAVISDESNELKITAKHGDVTHIPCIICPDEITNESQFEEGCTYIIVNSESSLPNVEIMFTFKYLGNNKIAIISVCCECIAIQDSTGIFCDKVNIFKIKGVFNE